MTQRNTEARKSRCGLTSTQIRDRATATHKNCSWCGSFKPAPEFAPDRRGLLGRAPQCRACWRSYVNARNRRPAIKARRQSFERTPERRQRSRLSFVRRKYGPEAEAVEKRRLAGEPCDICGRPGQVIDHSHQTDRIRGLLCNGCNTTLGKVGDDTDILAKMIEYLAHAATVDPL